MAAQAGHLTSKEPMNRKHDVPSTTSYSRDSAGHPEGEVSFGELLATFWEGRYYILGTVLLALLVGGYYIWRKTPIYQVDALLQIEEKKAAGKSGPAQAVLEGMFEQVTLAQAEIEIIKSNLVLGRAVEALDLDIVARPDFSLVVGDARMRGRNDNPEMLVDTFEVPGHLRGTTFQVVAMEDGAFRWEGPKGDFLAAGKVGETVQATYRGSTLSLKVRRLIGTPGERFDLERYPMLKVIGLLREDLRVAEKGKGTNILNLSFEHRSPGRGAEILNEVIGQYVRQNIERKAEEASKTLAFLTEQMPQLRGKLDAAEERLNQYRMKAGSVDLTEEAKSLLQQSVNLEGQILQVKQKKDELLRTYKENSDLVSTMNQQLSKLQKESTLLEDKVRFLPRTQQEVVRLTRDVQVNADLYTALLNNVQQLQVQKAGEIGNARIVDHAVPSLEPIKPQKAVAMSMATVIGIVSGIGLIMIRRALHQGVEDPRLIEGRLGLPVVVTIPHSDEQVDLFQKMRRREEGSHLLATVHPESLAVESLRSLRTSLAFSMAEARNRVVMISGPSPSIGKSFVSSNFAAVLSQTGVKVLLVDGDMRKGNLHRYFGIRHRKDGLSEALAGLASWRELVHVTDIPGLEVLTSGTLPPNPSELLMSGRFSDFVQEASETYDIVIIDAPPVLAVTDPVIIGGQAGTILLLVKSKEHPLDEIRTALNRFESAGLKPKGCVFNDVVSINVGYRYYRYAYHYGYKK